MRSLTTFLLAQALLLLSAAAVFESYGGTDVIYRIELRFVVT
ncbi:MAG: hypothetical protein ACN4GF_10560 [Lentimonas sp.]